MIIGKFLLGFQALSSDPVAYEPQRTALDLLTLPRLIFECEF